MDNTQETITDIIATKRRAADFIVQDAEAHAKAGVTTAGTPYDDCDLEQDRDRADEIRREADRLEAAHRREVDKLNSAIQATVGRSDAEIDRLRREIAELKRAGNAAQGRELSKNASKNGADFGQLGDVAKLREAAEKTRATLEEALQILNGISDEEAGRLNARLEDVADAICEVTQWIIPDALAAPATAEKSSAAGDAAKLREAIEAVLLAFNYGESTIVNQLPFSKLLPMLRKCIEALAEPSRNCDRFGGDIKMLRTAWFDWTGSPSGQNPDGTVKLTFGEWLLEKCEVRHA